MWAGLSESDRARLDAAFFTYFTLARADDIAETSDHESKTLFDSLDEKDKGSQTPFLSLFRRRLGECKTLTQALHELERTPELTQPTTWVLTGHPVDYRKGWIVSLQVEIGKCHQQLLQKWKESEVHDYGTSAYARVSFEYRHIQEQLQAKIQELLDSDHERY